MSKYTTIPPESDESKAAAHKFDHLDLIDLTEPPWNTIDGKFDGHESILTGPEIGRTEAVAQIFMGGYAWECRALS